MDKGLARLHQLIDQLESDSSWPWPPMNRSVSSEGTKMNQLYPHDPRDLSFADRVYTWFIAIMLDESLARERTYKHLVVIHQWDDNRALHASELAMDVQEWEEI